MSKKAFDTSSNPINDFLAPKKVVQLPAKPVETPVEPKTQDATKTLGEKTLSEINPGEIPSVEPVKETQQETKVKETTTVLATSLHGVAEKKVIKTRKRHEVIQEAVQVKSGRKVTKLPSVPMSYNLGEWAVQLMTIIRHERRLAGEVDINFRDIIEEGIEAVAYKHKIKPVKGVFPRPELVLESQE